jgi:hypothetical protein
MTIDFKLIPHPLLLGREGAKLTSIKLPSLWDERGWG